MRNMALGSLAACVAGALLTGGIVLATMPAASAAPAGAGAMRGAPTSADPGVERIQYRNGSCAELRRACLYKRELGETGQGNCSRYRSECSGGSGYSSSYSRYREYRAYRPYYRAYRSWRYWD
jgi:hypothetical protein